MIKWLMFCLDVLMHTSIPSMRLWFLGLMLTMSLAPASANQQNSGCPDGVEPLVRLLYSEEVRSDFWSKSLSRYSHLFEAAIYRQLLYVAKEQAQYEASRKGYVVVDIDIFSGTQWGTDGIKSIRCQVVDPDEVKVNLVILSGGKNRQFEHPVVVFLERDRLESFRWKVVDLGAYEDASLERGYHYLLSETLDDWLKRAGKSH